MKIHEYQATQLFKESGLPVVTGRVASEVYEAALIAEEVGYPVVLKSQVLVGGRGKAGGIKLVKDKTELQDIFSQLKNLTIKEYRVDKILVVKAITIVQEFYAAVTVDAARDDVVVIASAEGGVDIEETARTNPNAIKKYYIAGDWKLQDPRWAEFVRAVFPSPELQQKATAVFQALLEVFVKYDCSIAEINPLVIDDAGEMLAADAKVNFDDNALYRHEELLQLRDMDYEDADELEAKEHNLSFVKLEGDVGCIVNGAGLAMATMDIVQLCGGRPANFLDVGGSSNPEKVLRALQIILRNSEVKAILINIFGGITRCDDIAKGIIQARQQIDLPVPLVVRLTGTNEEEAKEMLSREGVTTFATMREAVERVVALAKGDA